MNDNGALITATPSYAPPKVAPLSHVKIVERFPWGGPGYGLLGRTARVVGMEARLAPISDAKWGNDNWDYKLEIDGEHMHPVWLPSSCIEVIDD